ncbi:MAG TPA: TonB-dependent receptor [Ohtaekwangia sp.]
MKYILILIGLLNVFLAEAQDSLRTSELEEVVVSATRSERSLSDLPVPIMVVSDKQIKSMGALRLNDVLTEQTGLAIISDHGTGVQIQGFSPDYTLILIDGEPLIGRSAGTLDLTRLAVGNIRQVEIIKGPSSSLYGTEALAGVVNIITDNPDGVNGSATLRYGTNNTMDVSGTVNYKTGKLGLSAFANRYGTDGYDLVPENKEKTVSPFYNYTLQSKITYSLSGRTKLSISGRYFVESQDLYEETLENDPLDVSSVTSDWNINPVLTHQFSDKLKATLRFYGTGFRNDMKYLYKSDGTYYDSTFFDQHFYRPELQVEYFLNSRNIFTLGGGRIWETVEATRFNDMMKYETDYIYFQYEWKPVDKLNIIAGGRYDNNHAYTPQFSPKFSAQYDVNEWLSLRGSVGVGFRAPDFRQLYLNFTNNTVGYSVFGTQEVAAGIQRLEDRGEIKAIRVDPASFGEINPEKSIAYNLGIRLKPVDKLTMNVGLFRNDIKDLIDTQIVAEKNDGNFVYSYYNIGRAFTEGIELDASYSLLRDISISAGYQFLIAKDKDVVEDLKAGKIYKRDPETNITTRVSPDEYGGLLDRSKHMFNVKLFYENSTSGWGGSIRTVYRGRYGVMDMNNSGILDDDSEYVEGYATFNVSLSKTFYEMVRLQAGCDNVFDYTNPEYIAALPGRLVWISVGITLKSKKNN